MSDDPPQLGPDGEGEFALEELDEVPGGLPEGNNTNCVQGCGNSNCAAACASP